MPSNSIAEIGEVVPNADVVQQEERRSEVRRAYPVTQVVAFHDESETPTKEMFRPVLCQDISPSGISFYLSGPPAADHCTIVLGRKPMLIFVKAKVVHYGPYLGPKREWVIGCEFLGKVGKPV